MPFEIQAALERAVMAPFIPDESGKLLQYHADASNVGITYKLTLSFEAAMQKATSIGWTASPIGLNSKRPTAK